MKANWNRREFIKKSGAATMAALAAGAPFASMIPGCGRSKSINTTADTVILLWMGGGMAHTETFDPKKYTEFTKGMEANRVLSTFPSMLLYHFNFGWPLVDQETQILWKGKWSPRYDDGKNRMFNEQTDFKT